jgi:uncharacterized protein (DUF2252 family)
VVVFEVFGGRQNIIGHLPQAPPGCSLQDANRVSLRLMSLRTTAATHQHAQRQSSDKRASASQKDRKPWLNAYVRTEYEPSSTLLRLRAVSLHKELNQEPFMT